MQSLALIPEDSLRRLQSDRFARQFLVGLSFGLKINRLQPLAELTFFSFRYFRRSGEHERYFSTGRFRRLPSTRAMRTFRKRAAHVLLFATEYRMFLVARVVHQCQIISMNAFSNMEMR